MENTSGMMVQCTKVCGLRTKLTEEESTSGQMAESMTANGKITICTVKVSIHGKMVECIKVNMKMIASTDTVPIPGMTVNNMPVGGKMESNTEKVPTVKTAVIARVSGKMVKESDGLMIPSGKICKMWDNHNKRILDKLASTELNQNNE
jgi:hypothetical protein